MRKIDKDTLNGVYVPKDLEDCFSQLDTLLSVKIKTGIKVLKNKKETTKYHLGLGMTLRNRWGLWGGSRLQKYFLDRKVNHPDEMSSIILEYYHDWLNDNNEAWQKWIR